jgi:glycosyltransferase involved in cell wall biosynthesis
VITDLSLNSSRAASLKGLRFSVLIPTHNREKFVREAVDSVRAQTFTNYELIVIDDGSTDRTQEVLESYGTCIKVVRQANQGPEVARNKGAAVAHGEYLVLLDSDDLFLPCALALYDRIIRAFDAPPLILGSVLFFEDGKAMRAEALAPYAPEILRFQDFLSKDRPITISSSRIVVRKSLFDEVGGLRNTTASTYHLDDLNLLLKVGTNGPCIVVQRPYTVAYRVHATNGSRNPTGMVDGMLSLVGLERAGQYTGADKRCFDRHAVIGAMAWDWIKESWRRGFPKPALRLFLGAAHMLPAATWTKFARRLRRPVQPIVLAEGLRPCRSESRTSSSGQSRPLADGAR